MRSEPIGTEAGGPRRAEGPIRVTYGILMAPGEDAAAKAAEIALEQTVELPEDCVPAAIRERVVGRVEGLEPIAASRGRWRAVIAYAPATVGDDAAQLLNLLFGNVSLLRGVRIEAVEFPPAFLSRLGGPRFGVDGLRSLCGAAAGRPLLCAAAKPLGLSPEELADRCYRFARAGFDIVKDDHGLANQPDAPFAERVARCQEAVARANAEAGGNTLYAPNVTGAGLALGVRLEAVREAGCRAVLIAPLLVGLDSVHGLAARGEVAILAHPALAGAFFHDEHGIAPEVLLGCLFRVVGCDGVIYPNVGGRFPFSASRCQAINEALRGPMGELRRAFPVPGGGVEAARVPHWIEAYGPDTILLVGSTLYREADLDAAAARLVRVVRGG